MDTGASPYRMPLCPVCGGQLKQAERSYTIAEILALWEPIRFSESTIDQLHQQADHTARHLCESCGLEIYLPPIVGTPDFYIEAYNLRQTQLYSDFTYSSGKWDFEEALRDARGGLSVIELGCGPGNFLARVKPFAKCVLGTEYNEAAAGEARKKGITVVGADADLKRFEEQFDRVFSFHVVEHVADPMAFFKRAINLASPGGKIGISVPNQSGPINYIRPCAMNMPPHHATRWRLRSFQAIAQVLGLEIERVAYEPLLLDNHSYYSRYWVAETFPGTTRMLVLWRWVLSLSLRVVFRGARLLGLRYLPGLRGQSIYVLFRKPDQTSVRAHS